MLILSGSKLICIKENGKHTDKFMDRLKAKKEFDRRQNEFWLREYRLKNKLSKDKNN